MSKLQNLKKYLYKSIEDYGGVTSPDYKEFEKTYKNYLKEMVNDIGGELVNFSPNHYEFSCFIKRNGKFAYMSISDVRYWHNEWHNHILVRTASNETDYKGGSNNYTNLDNLGYKILELTK